jgi:hypothetical protein
MVSLWFQAKLARLKEQYEDMRAKAMQADRMTEELASLRQQMIQVSQQMVQVSFPGSCQWEGGLCHPRFRHLIQISCGSFPGPSLHIAGVARPLVLSRPLVRLMSGSLLLLLQVATPLKLKSLQVAPPQSHPLVTGDRNGGSPAVDGDWHLVDGSPEAPPSNATATEEDQEEDARVLSAHLGHIRAQHASLVAQRDELLRLTADSQLLIKDNEVLRMQLNVAVSLYGVEAMPVVDASPVEPGVPRGGEAAGSEDCSKGADPGYVTKPLDAVFQRMRFLESQNMGLTARNKELHGQAEYLHTALEASLNRLEAFKGLAATVGLIRGRNPSSGIAQT